MMNIKNLIFINWKLIVKKSFKNFTIVLSGLSTLISFISIDEIIALYFPNNKAVWVKFGVYVVCLLIVIVLTGIYYIFRKGHVLWKQGNRSIFIKYGDILKITNWGHVHNKDIVVIPVNTDFDTIVEEASSDIKRLVSPRSLHGMWLEEMKKNGYSNDSIDALIKESLEKQEIISCASVENIKSRGNIKRYEKGTIAVVNFDDNTTYYLLALADFDKNNNASATTDDLIYVLHKLMNYYNKNSQGSNLYLPLMGTGFSRIDISLKESLDITKMSLLLNKHLIQGNVGIVIFKKNRDKVSLED